MYAGRAALSLSVRFHEYWTLSKSALVSVWQLGILINLRLFKIEWKGEIDTLRGDEPNQRVRTAAKVKNTFIICIPVLSTCYLHTLSFIILGSP